MSLFYPQDRLKPHVLGGYDVCPDRSSDFPALLATFPFIREQWYAMAKRVPFSQDLYKNFLFAQFLRQTKILILEILNVLLWLKFPPSLNLNKNEHFSKVIPPTNSEKSRITAAGPSPNLTGFPIKLKKAPEQIKKILQNSAMIVKNKKRSVNCLKRLGAAYSALKIITQVSHPNFYVNSRHGSLFTRC
jgi:hypothetical protein